MDPQDDRALMAVAHYRAARAVVHYRITGSADGAVSIAPEPESAWLDLGGGTGIDCFGSRARILASYAGGHALRRLGSYACRDCPRDEAIAALELRRWGWEAETNALRAESRDLVDRHWKEIGAIARELLHASTLDEAQVAVIADAAAAAMRGPRR